MFKKRHLFILPIALIPVSGCGLKAEEKLKNKAKILESEPLIEEASNEAITSMANMSYPDELTLSLVAAEPMFANAVAFTFDEQGRIFIAESHRTGSSVIDVRSYRSLLERDLSLRKIEDREAMINDLFEAPEDFAVETEMVRMLEDTDGDGVMDKSSIYADGFNSKLDGIASGVLARNGKLWFTNIPSLTQFEGIDADGKAEKQTELLRGFGVRFGLYGHDLHGLAWGPDGKLYFSIGDRGSHVVSQEGKTFANPDTGAVFRSDPDGSNFEVFAHGLRNPQELAFDEYGNLFTGDNDCDNGDEERLVHVVEDGDSGWRVGYQHSHLGRAGMWMLEKLWKPRHEGQPAYFLAPIGNIADGPSGLAYYPGTGLNESYKGHFFLCHFKGSRASSSINTYTVNTDGASYQLSESKKFLKGVLPTDVTFGYDGKLYYSDWITGWGKTGKGRIYALSDPKSPEASAAKQVQELFKNGFSSLSQERLRELLGHADQRVRLEAQFTLAERGKGSIETFATLATDSSSPLLPRLHAIWGLGQLGHEATSQNAILGLLGDPEDEVRAQATKLIGDIGLKASKKPLVSLLRDPSPRVQFFAAQSLAKVGDLSNANDFVELLRRNSDADQYIRHVGVMGLVKTNNADVLATASNDPSKAVRLGALTAYRRLRSPKVAIFLSDPEPFLVLEAARAINGEEIVEAYSDLAALVATQEAKTNFLLGMRVLNAQFRLGKKANLTALANFAADPIASEKLRVEAIQHIGAWPEPPQRDRIGGLYRPLPTRSPRSAKAAFKPILLPLLQQQSGKIQSAAIKVTSQLKLKKSSDDLYSIIVDEDAATLARVAALEALDMFDDDRLLSLVELASQSDKSALRQASLPIAARLDPETATPILRNIIRNGAAKEMQTAFNALKKMEHPLALEILKESLDLLASGKIPNGAELELIEAAKASKSERIAAKLAEREKLIASSDDPLAPYHYALEGGDWRSGWNVFHQHPAMACVRCHKLDDLGGEAGPELTEIAKDNDLVYLLESIIKPSARIAPGFETAVINKTDGTTVVGTILERTEEHISLKLPHSPNLQIARSEIASATSMPSSMPEIFQTLLTPKELRDVMAYLARMDGKPEKGEGH